MSAPTAQPNGKTAAAVFVLGVLLGGALVAPAVLTVGFTLPPLPTAGPVGKTLLLGLLGIVLVVLGLGMLYLVFLVIDQ